VSIAREGGALTCDSVSLEALAAAHGTPLYVYSGGAIRAAYASYVQAFGSVPHRVCYALKANGTGGVLRLLARQGAGADIVSGFEMQAALRAGFPADRIVFSGVGKTDGEMRDALAAGIAAFNAESGEEIERLSRIAQETGRVAPVALRVNPNIDARSHPYISTGLEQSKFGVPIGAALGILERARALPAVRVLGVQCHIGSQIEDLEPLREAAAALAALSRELLARGFSLSTIDLGGGLGLDYETGEAARPAALAGAVLPLVKDLGLTVLLEPGRSLVAAAGVLLTRVLYVKDNGGRTFVVVDAGMNDLLRPALYDAFHRIEHVRPGGAPQRTVDVVGPVCESSDFLARGRAIEECAAGDLLAVRDTGAYGASMGSNYNLRPRPAEVLVEGGVARVVRRRETFLDLIHAEDDAEGR
jgi:diaminopimelate decarboxylase